MFLVSFDEVRKYGVKLKLMRCKRNLKNGDFKFQDCLSIVSQCVLENAC